MSKPVYLPHCTIPVQLQTEVRKCLDTWLKQGIIRPSHSPYASQVVKFAKSLERYIYVSISELLMLLPSATHFLCLILRKPYKQLSRLCGLPYLIWPKVICNWLWMRLTSIKQHSVQVCLVSTSSLICHSVCLMWVLVFVISWRCVLGINSISHFCSILMISVCSAALLARCWTGLSWYWNDFRISISKSSLRNLFFNHKFYFWVIHYPKMGFL